MRVVLPRVMPDRTLERLHGGGALLGARLHQNHSPASPGNRQMDTDLLGPGSARALERARYLVEAPPVVLDRLRDADAEFGGEGVLGGKTQPAKEERGEAEVECRAGRPLVCSCEQMAGRLPELGGQARPVPVQLGDVLGREANSVRERVERGEQMRGGWFHG